MSHRPYPNPARALRQLRRHEEEWCPGGAWPRPLPALYPSMPEWVWRQPEPPQTIRISTEQRETLLSLPQVVQRWYDGIGTQAVAAARQMCEASRHTRRP